jgi:hypothetical protein
MFDAQLLNEEWFRKKMAKTDLVDLAMTGHKQVDPYLINAFVERWHEETASFHMPVGEVTVTLDDMSCLLHLSNEGRLLDHGFLDRARGIDLMVRLLGSDPADVSKEIHVTKGDHAKHTYLQRHFKTFLPHIADYTEEGNEDEVLRHQNFVVRTYSAAGRLHYFSRHEQEFCAPLLPELL